MNRTRTTAAAVALAIAGTAGLATSAAGNGGDPCATVRTGTPTTCPEPFPPMTTAPPTTEPPTSTTEPPATTTPEEPTTSTTLGPAPEQPTDPTPPLDGEETPVLVPSQVLEADPADAVAGSPDFTG